MSIAIGIWQKLMALTICFILELTKMRFYIVLMICLLSWEVHIGDWLQTTFTMALMNLAWNTSTDIYMAVCL